MDVNKLGLSCAMPSKTHKLLREASVLPEFCRSVNSFLLKLFHKKMFLFLEAFRQINSYLKEWLWQISFTLKVGLCQISGNILLTISAPLPSHIKM